MENEVYNNKTSEDVYFDYKRAKKKQHINEKLKRDRKRNTRTIATERLTESKNKKVMQRNNNTVIVEGYGDEMYA